MKRKTDTARVYFLLNITAKYMKRVQQLIGTYHGVHMKFMTMVPWLMRCGGSAQEGLVVDQVSILARR